MIDTVKRRLSEIVGTKGCSDNRRNRRINRKKNFKTFLMNGK